MTIPCGACRACCINQAAFLRPEDGDPASYAAERVPRGLREAAYEAMGWRPVWAIRRMPSGECVHLSASGCSIYGRRPAICRKFDCGDAYSKLKPAKRRELTRRDPNCVVTAGRRINQWREAKARGENPPPPFGERKDE